MIFKHHFFLLLLMAVIGAPLTVKAEMIDFPQVKIQALNKSTARTKTLTAKVGETIEYGSLFIKVQSCRKSEPLDKPEDASFLQIWEIPIGKDKSEWAFSGWMFSSSPAVSAMDHAIYDVWVLECFDPDAKPVEPVNKIIVNDEEFVDQPEDETEYSEQQEMDVLDEEKQPITAPIAENSEEESSFESPSQSNIIEAEPFDALIDNVSTNDIITYE
ncbi:MAG: DUF2155 domain-containing protein [Pseudomonadota bacterium]